MIGSPISARDVVHASRARPPSLLLKMPMLLNKLPIPDLSTMGHGDEGVYTSGFSINTNEVYLLG